MDSSDYWLILNYRQGKKTCKIPLALGSLIGAGGTAAVYRVENAPTPTVAKIYSDTGLGLAATRARAVEKLRVMTQNSARLSEALPFVSWPQHLITTACDEKNPDGLICGFTMPKFANTRSLERLFVITDGGGARAPTEMAARARSGALLCEKLSKLHAYDIYLGDFSARNVHVSPDLNRLYFIDADGFQLSLSPSPGNVPVPYPITGTSYGYRSRRLATSHYLSNSYPLVIAEDDEAALAILLFQLLTLYHPFETGDRFVPLQGTPSPFREDNMLSGRFPYADMDDRYDLDSTAAASWQVLSSDLQDAFRKAFTLSPLKALDWIPLLTRFRHSIS